MCVGGGGGVANVKLSLRASRTLRWSARINIGTNWRWAVSFTSRPALPRRKRQQYPLNKRLGVSTRSLCGRHENTETSLAPARNRIPPRSHSPWPIHYTDWAISHPTAEEESNHCEDVRFHPKSTKCYRDTALRSLRHFGCLRNYRASCSIKKNLSRDSISCERVLYVITLLAARPLLAALLLTPIPFPWCVTNCWRLKRKTTWTGTWQPSRGLIPIVLYTTQQH